MSIKVAINGYGTIGKRVADAVDAQDDMEIIGVTKTRPSFGCDLAVRKGFPLYCTFDDAERIAAFGDAGYTCHGGLSDLLAVADVVVDCSPGKVGAANKETYVKAGVKYIFQGGEKTIDYEREDWQIQAWTIQSKQDTIILVLFVCTEFIKEFLFYSYLGLQLGLLWDLKRSIQKPFESA